MRFSICHLLVSISIALPSCTTTPFITMPEDIHHVGGSIVTSALLEVGTRDSIRVIFFPHSFTIKESDSTWSVKGVGFVRPLALSASFLESLTINSTEILWLKQIVRENYDWLGAAIGVPVVGFMVYKIIELWSRPSPLTYVATK